MSNTENDFIFFMLSTPLYSKVISVALRPKRIFKNTGLFHIKIILINFIYSIF